MRTALFDSIPDRVSRLRMALLGYEYDYDRAANQAIINDVLKQYDSLINQVDRHERRLARAVAQYQAHLLMRPPLSIWFFELVSAVALLPFVFICWLVGPRTNNPGPQQDVGVRLVFAKRWKSNPEIFSIPGELKTNDIETRNLTGQSLTKGDTQLVFKLLWRALSMRAAFPFQLALKCAVDLAKVRAALQGQRPSFVLVYWEFSCSLSFITEALSGSEIETYNVMHGDKFYYAKHAFFEATRCYCWNQFYVDLFTEEHAKADFRVFNNTAFSLSESEQTKREACHTGTIGIAAPHLATLSDNKDQDAKAVAGFSRAVNRLSDKYSVKVRPHPFYESDFEKFKPLLSPAINVESHRVTSPRSFLMENEIIVGTVSTLLLEAAHLGFPVVILNTKMTESVQSYHYLYQMENVYIATLETLATAVADIDAKRMLRQTVP